MTKISRAKSHFILVCVLLGLTPATLANDELHDLIEKSIKAYHLEDADTDASIRYAQEALKIAEASNNVKAKANALFLLGRSFKRKKQPVEAEKYLTLSLQLNRQSSTQQRLIDNLIHLSDAMRFSQHFEQAIIYIDEAISLLTTLDENQLALDAHNVKGNIYKSAEDYEAAINQYLVALPYATALDDPTQTARIYRRLAWANKRLGLTEKTLEYTLKRAQYLEKIDDKGNLAKVYSELSKSYKKQGLNTQAAVFGIKALEQAKETANRESLIQSYLSIAETYDSSDEVESAIAYHKKALILIEQIGDPTRIAAELESLSKDERKLGLYGPALENAKRALQIQETLKNDHRVARLLLEISSTYRKLSSYDAALEYSVRALKIYARDDDLNGIASASNELGLLYSRLRQYNDAAKYYNKTLILGLEEIDPKYRAAAFRGMAVVAQNADDLDKALEYAKASEKIYIETRSDHGTATVNRTIGRIYENINEPEKALKAYMIALKYSRAIDNRWSEASSLIHIGKLQFRLKNKKVGKNNVLKGLNIAKELSAKSLLVNSYAALMRMEESQGNYKPAYVYSKRHISISAEINQEEITQRIAELQIVHETEKHERQIDMLKDQSQINELELGRQSAELEVLNKQKTISELQLERERFIRTMFLGFSILVVLALVLLYNRFRYTKQRQMMLNEKNNQIESKNSKLEDLNATKDRFFSIIAHDLRGPVSSLVSLTQMLEDNFDSYNKEEIKKYISAVNSSSTQTHKLLDDLLEWAIQQLRNTDPVPRIHLISDICVSVKNTLAVLAEVKEIEIINNIDPSLTIYGDRNMITTVVRNLVANSIKFSEHKGTINLYASDNDNEITIHVKDEGVGMDKKQIKHLFQIDKMMSRRGTNGEKGTGFGLALCKDLIEKNNGTISVSSEKSIGSDFRFTLPRKKPTP